MPSKQPTQSTDARVRASTWFPSAIIFILGFALYANTIQHGYALDDKVVITHNQFTEEGVSGIRDILSHDTLTGFLGIQKRLVAGGRYRPLSLVTFAVEHQILGQNPHVSHFINVLLYALTGVLLYTLLSTLLVSHRSSRRWYFSLPFIATLLYVAHPIHTEVVANIKGRDDIMALLGALLALYYTLRYLGTNKVIYLIINFVVFFLALMSKENAVTFVALIPLAAFFFTKHGIKKNLISTIPLLLATILFLAIRHKALGGPTVETGPELMNDPFLYASRGQELATIFYTWLIYLRLLVFPHPLTYDYYPKQIDIINFGDPRAIASVLIYSAFAVIAVAGLRRRGLIAYGIWLYALTFSVVSNLVFNVGTFMNERFVYAPSLGFCLVGAYLLVRRVPRLFKSENAGRRVLSGTLMAILCLYSTLVLSRNRAWANDYTLFTHDTRVSSKSAKSACWAGGELTNEALKLREIRMQGASVDEIAGRIDKETHLPKAEKSEFLASSNLDTLKLKIEKRENEMRALAFTYLNRSVEINPKYIDALLLLAKAYFQLDGNYEKAAESCLRILRMNPNYGDAYVNLESYLNQCEDADLQIRTWEEASEIDPNRFEPNFHLGKLYGSYKNDIGKAIPFLERSVQLDPTSAKAYNNLGVAYGLSGRFTEAIQALERAVQLDPTDAQAYTNLAVTYSSMGNEAKASEYFKKAANCAPAP